MTTPMLPSARPDEVGLSAARLDAIGEVLRRKIGENHIPGAVALVARNGRVAWFEAFGRRDPAATDAMTRDTLFRIYSMTKPIVSVAAMMLWEEGRFLLSDPVSAYLPEFKAMEVLQPGATPPRRPARAPITIQDLLRHTSGLTYEFRGETPLHKAYQTAKLGRSEQTNADQAAALAKLPLLHEPGTVWEYSRSTDVLGRLLEVISGQTLGALLRTCLLEPLGMTETGFHVPPADHGRIAQAFAKDPDTGTAVQLLDPREPPEFESGGGGLVGSAADYARFLQMLLGNGRAGNGVRLLGRKTVELMTADHLGPIEGAPDLLPPGYGFGLGFAVRRTPGIAFTPGSVGQYYWSGIAGTSFWVDPAERLYALLLTQAPGPREYYRVLFRDMVYAAIDD